MLLVKTWFKIGLGISSLGLLLLIYLGLRQPQWMFRLVSQLRPGALFFVNTEQPIIALTIDDGPNEGTTEEILQVLEPHGVKATFFMLSDQRLGHEATLQRLVASGHELGNHMTKDEASIRLAPEEFKTDFLAADDALSVYGPVSWFRPGMGWYRDSMLTFVESQGYQTVLGSLFPYDTHVASVQFAEWFVLNNLNPGDILVLHDGAQGRGQRTVALLKQLLPQIQQQGYQVVTLTELYQYHQ